MSEVRCDEGPAPAALKRGAARGSEVEVESAEARAMRLRSLRDAIASGEYQIGAEAVASKVMERMRSQAKPVGEVSVAEETDGSRTRVGRAEGSMRRTGGTVRPAADSSQS